jgi:hypothetical protein
MDRTGWGEDIQADPLHRCWDDLAQAGLGEARRAGPLIDAFNVEMVPRLPTRKVAQRLDGLDITRRGNLGETDVALPLRLMLSIVRKDYVVEGHGLSFGGA